MKLKTLYVQEYKNLVDFTINFEVGEGLSILVGNNGSGKSNLLEMISGIFHDLFTYKAKRKIKCDYRLEYDLDGIECKLEQKKGTLWCHGPRHTDRKLFVERMGPNNVIGLYSGEEDRLWTSFYREYYESYIRRINSHKHQGRMRLVFVNKYYWNIALLTLLLSDNSTVKQFLETDVGIKSVSDIELEFDFRNFDEANELLKAFIDKINPKHKTILKYRREKFKELVSGDDIIDDMEVFRCLAQAYMPKRKKIVSRITIEVNGGIAIEQLSEGEKKLILVKAVLEILSDEKTLVLMDEPDAHLHEIRKEQLYSMMTEYNNRQIIIASHSPTIIDIAESEQIIMLKPDKGKARVYEAGKIETVRELTGRRINVFVDKPILYCEGTETGVDAALYAVLFPGYRVIPAGGHEEVVNLTKTYNKTFGSKRNYAIGIIDWDYRTETQLSALRREGIYSLRVVEVENVLMDLVLLEAAKKRFCSRETCIDEVQKVLFSDCKQRKEYQAAKYTASNTVSKIQSGISPDSGAIKKFKDRVKKVCDIAKIDAMYNERLKCLDEYIAHERFAEIVGIYDFNHDIDRFVKAVVNDYKERILRLIQKRGDLQKFLRTKYYSDVVGIKDCPQHKSRG